MAKWTKNHPMMLGALLLGAGLVLTVIASIYNWMSPHPGWLTWYDNLVERPEGNWNLVVFIIGPILLIWGGFTVGEQIVLRRRFERLIDTPKKSDFAANRRELEDLSKKLPEEWKGRITAKEAEFRSRRA